MNDELNEINYSPLKENLSNVKNKHGFSVYYAKT